MGINLHTSVFDKQERDNIPVDPPLQGDEQVRVARVPRLGLSVEGD